MVTKIFPVVASDRYAEKELSPNTLHLGPSPSIISKRQLQAGLIHYSEVHIIIITQNNNNTLLIPVGN